jgi:nucleoside-diphosphate-sugar epimerase
MVSINELVSLIEGIAGIKLKRHYKLDAPKGVRGRNSDNTLIQARLGWEPNISLKSGLEKTYAWINSQLVARREASV